MSFPKSPFAPSTSTPGHGTLTLSLLPPAHQVLTQCTYQYPLKLIAPDPHRDSNDRHITVAFLLTYGGGLIGGDKIDLTVSLAPLTKLVLLTQGSTKIFKSPSRDIVSGQTLNVTIGAGAALCYLPDPTQPFGQSVYEQRQDFIVDEGSSLCVLDWVSEGRKARGESWHLWSWRGRNEVKDSRTGRLLLRDSLILDDDELQAKTNKMGVFGTLFLYGPIFAQVGAFFVQEFMGQPKMGNKSWRKEHEKSDAELEAEIKQAYEKREGLLWTAASVRGFVLVKFGSRDIDGARRWLGGMLKREGSVEREFGHQAFIALR